MLAWAWLITIVFLGILAGRRYGRLASFSVMMELPQIIIVILGAYRGIMAGFDAYTRPLDLLMFLIPGVGFLPPTIMGRYGGLSAGGLVLWVILLVIFALVAMFSRRGQEV
jgi:hypothetical protein